ncbi:hypothetical protein RF11_09881 [Thelohanellus kitauei]|uniref:Uncharacterized protein n=1 Tax=Thelohanellus kitauei TaxID=669202 RepID=A0A0C2J4R4_THEKT|nr:hypothetical protein RF11_09881 [Thelohanellus kitauei]
MKDDRASMFYQSAVEIFLRNGHIEKAIERLYEYGYKYQKEFMDSKKEEPLYDQADNLRLQHNLTHSCVITEFVESDFKEDLETVLDVYQRFEVTTQNGDIITATHACN